MTPAPDITIQGVASIDGTPLFGPLEFTVSEGWNCLLGPSGSGKSTLLRLLAGLETATRFEGQIAPSDEAPLPPRVAFMAQSDLLLPWLSVLGNVTLGAQLRGEAPDTSRAAALLSDLGLRSHAAKRPHELSGGQRQRVALARVLMEDRPVVLLDEPFSALDARTRADMQELAFEVLAGRTVVLVTHDPAEAARMGERIWVLDDGNLRPAEPPPLSAIRPVSDPETLASAAALLDILRAAR